MSVLRMLQTDQSADLNQWVNDFLATTTSDTGEALASHVRRIHVKCLGDSDGQELVSSDLQHVYPGLKFSSQQSESHPGGCPIPCRRLCFGLFQETAGDAGSTTTILLFTFTVSVWRQPPIIVAAYIALACPTCCTAPLLTAWLVMRGTSHGLHGIPFVALPCRSFASWECQLDSRTLCCWTWWMECRCSDVKGLTQTRHGRRGVSCTAMSCGVLRQRTLTGPAHHLLLACPADPALHWWG
eukprot:jgi/Ulvmu1/11913/UM081_0073.1